jgi:hypothetical protein
MPKAIAKTFGSQMSRRLPMITISLTEVLEKTYHAVVAVHNFHVASAEQNSVTLEVTLKISAEDVSKAFIIIEK